MAAATSLAAIASGGGTGGPSPASSSRIQEERPSRQRIRVSTPREQRRAIWGSGFLGQLELRGALGGREAGSVGGRNLRLRRRTVGVARAGLPVVSSIPVLGPVLNAFLNPVVVFILYAAGASRFWSGFERTSYSNSAPTKVALTALWPGMTRGKGTRTPLLEDIGHGRRLEIEDNAMSSVDC